MLQQRPGLGVPLETPAAETDARSSYDHSHNGHAVTKVRVRLTAAVLRLRLFCVAANTALPHTSLLVSTVVCSHPVVASPRVNVWSLTRSYTCGSDCTSRVSFQCCSTSRHATSNSVARKGAGAGDQDATETEQFTDVY